jgi:hypothetical protein
MRLPFMSNRRRRQVDDLQRQLASIQAQIEINERALNASAAEVEPPSPYRGVLRVRESILESELAENRAEADILTARAAVLEVAWGEKPLGRLPGSRLQVDKARRAPNRTAPVRLRAAILAALPVVAALLVAVLPVESSWGLLTPPIAAQEAVAAPEALAGDWVATPTAPYAFAGDWVATPTREEHGVSPGASANAPPDPMLLSVEDFVEAERTVYPDSSGVLNDANSDQLTEGAEAEAQHESSPPRPAVVTLVTVRLREQPSTTARTPRSIPAGVRLDVINGSTRDWSHVQTHDGVTGWIISSALRPA